MNRDEAIWFAGLLDGEGWIGITKVSHDNSIHTYHPVIAVDMTHKETIKRLSEITGHIKMQTYQKPTGNRRPIYIWRANRFIVVRDILPKVIPFLFTKQNQARAVYSWITNRPIRESGKRPSLEKIEFDEMFYQKLKIMNKRGVAV